MSASYFKELYMADLKRYGGIIDRDLKKFHYYFRKIQTTKNKFLRLYYRFQCRRIKLSRGLEIAATTDIGAGLYLGHAYHITINPSAKLGKNVNLHKGVTIGQENRGIRKGVPTIGNNVWIGVNSTVVGKITIGDDVLIAPNTYVNCDIPSHSIVLGNPCVIKPRDWATKDYINYTID
jgi:serine O-acetyltransferase